MAIRRCPYCKAIIDEQDKYCNNCGTQLLFPEDEFVEEEIPGDKIIDTEEPEEAEDEDKTEEKELEEELEEEEEEEEEEEDEEQDEDEEEDEKDEEKEVREEALTGELDLKTDEDTDELKAPAGIGEPEAEEEGTGSADRERDEDDAEEKEDEFAGTGRPAEAAPHEAPRDRDEKKYEVLIEDDEIIFKTKPVPDQAGGAEDERPERVRPPDTASLPPWASRIRETPATVEPAVGARGTTPLSREWTTDSGIGIPERITQAALPFGDTGTREVPPIRQETDEVDEETRDATSEIEEAGPPGGLSLKLRAKFVDWVFVTALWVISLWFTAQVVGVSFFRLLFGSPLPILAFYLILLVLYFFLFLYFLGETLGDHYFSE